MWDHNFLTQYNYTFNALTLNQLQIQLETIFFRWDQKKLIDNINIY